MNYFNNFEKNFNQLDNNYNEVLNTYNVVLNGNEEEVKKIKWYKKIIIAITVCIVFIYGTSINDNWTLMTYLLNTNNVYVIYGWKLL